MSVGLCSNLFYNYILKNDYLKRYQNSQVVLGAASMNGLNNATELFCIIWLIQSHKARNNTMFGTTIPTQAKIGKIQLHKKR